MSESLESDEPSTAEAQEAEGLSTEESRDIKEYSMANDGTTLNELDSSLVTTGTPVEGGCAWTSFEDSPVLPENATAKMAELAGFESLGELSDNGFTEGRDVSTTDHKGWHGSVLLTSIDSETNTVKAEFLEVSRPAAAKLRYGADAVTVGDDGSVAQIKAKRYTGKAVPLVFDELESDGHLRRTVIKKAVVKSFDDVPHQRGSLLVFGMTFTINDPADGSEPYIIYRAKPE